MCVLEQCKLRENRLGPVHIRIILSLLQRGTEPVEDGAVEQFSVTKDLKSDDSELFVHEGPGFTDISHSSDQTDLFTSYVSLDTSSGLSDNVDAFVNDFELQEDSNQEQYFEKYLS